MEFSCSCGSRLRKNPILLVANILFQQDQRQAPDKARFCIFSPWGATFVYLDTQTHQKILKILHMMTKQLYHMSNSHWFGTGFSRIFGLENFIKFFQCATLRLYEKEVNEDRLKDIPEHEENIAMVG
jgi:hypothetical protein